MNYLEDVKHLIHQDLIIMVKLNAQKKFFAKFINDINFLHHYTNWQNNNFERRFAPSIDRIDNTGDYVLDNLQFISQRNNSTKDVKIPVTVYFNEILFGTYASQKEAAIATGQSEPSVCYAIKFNKSQKGYRYVRL